LRPGPSACEADVMPLYHVPSAKHGTQVHRLEAHYAVFCAVGFASYVAGCLSGIGPRGPEPPSRQWKSFAETRGRTGDLQIFSLALSQLSYRGIFASKLSKIHARAFSRKHEQLRNAHEHPRSTLPLPRDACTHSASTTRPNANTFSISPPSSAGRAQGPYPCCRGFEPHVGCFPRWQASSCVISTTSAQRDAPTTLC
jgi:hypothetical protein